MANIPKIDHKRERDRKIAAKNRREIIAAQLSRRGPMKMGLLTGAGHLFTQKEQSARASALRDNLLNRLAPFVEPLLIPPKIHCKHNLNTKGSAPPFSGI